MSCVVWRESVSDYKLKLKIARTKNQNAFLQRCIEEQVLPRSAPRQLQHKYKPFSEAARTYLAEASQDLNYRIEELQSKASCRPLPRHLDQKLHLNIEKHKANLQRKLHALYDKSKWTEVGRLDLITNLSSRNLSKTEKAALSLGLKFDTGIQPKTFIHSATRNYRWNDNDVDKGFYQGLTACLSYTAEREPPALPKRYIKALQELGKTSNIVITQADKGGGIVLLDHDAYITKMQDLLQDSNTYCKIPKGQIKKESQDFNKSARKILSSSTKGKKLLHLLEETPKSPTMKGLPKIHKPNMPMRPITSGVGSAPHRLAKTLAAPLSKALGTISDCHLRNSRDLMTRLKQVNFHNKKLASFDVKSLYTNVPTASALEAAKRVVNSKDEEDFPLEKESYMQLLKLCVEFNCFEFEREEYKQIQGLAMGSPISAVLANLYMETLELDHFRAITGPRVTWLRYVDDILTVLPRRTRTDQVLQDLNRVEPKIQFTIEEENDGTLPFLDTVIIRTDSGPKFKVYRKPTNKEDYVHFLSAHPEKTKSGIVIGFFLRALRICDSEFLTEEQDHIMEKFLQLGYPKGLLLSWKRKALKIHERPKEERDTAKVIRITVPNSKTAQDIQRHINCQDLQLAISSGKKIKDLVRKPSSQKSNQDSCVYEIPCRDCDKKYIGETHRGLPTRIREHKRDFQHMNTSNAIVIHAIKEGHAPEFTNAKTLEEGIHKAVRKGLESAYIAITPNFNGRIGSHLWAKAAALAALNCTRSHDTKKRPHCQRGK